MPVSALPAHPAQMPSKPSNITVRNNLFFIVRSELRERIVRTLCIPTDKNRSDMQKYKKLLRKTTDRTGESLRVAGKSAANAPRPARSATPLGTESSRFPGNGGPLVRKTAALGPGCPVRARPKPPPVKAALLENPEKRYLCPRNPLTHEHDVADSVAALGPFSRAERGGQEKRAELERRDSGAGRQHARWRQCCSFPCRYRAWQLRHAIRESAFYIPPVSARSCTGVSCSRRSSYSGAWIFGFFATKRLPLTISASIKATRPAFVVLGAVLIFGERLDATRWTGVAVVLGALAALSRLDKRDGRDDRESPRRKTLWLWFLIASTLLGAASALWDKFLIARYDRLAVQAYTCYYQSLMMIAIVMTMWYPSRKRSTPFRWRWSIFLTAVLLTAADFLYFYALSDPQALLSVVSTIRRSGVVVAFRRGRADVPRAADRHEGRAARCRAGRSRAALFRITYRKFRKASRQGKQTAGALRPKPARTRPETVRQAFQSPENDIPPKVRQKTFGVLITLNRPVFFGGGKDTSESHIPKCPIIYPYRSGLRVFDASGFLV